MKTLFLLSLSLFSLSGNANSYHEVELGKPTVFERHIRFDLNLCKATFTVKAAPETYSLVGSCRVALEKANPLIRYENAFVHYLKTPNDAPSVYVSGNGGLYGFSVYVGAKETLTWEMAEVQFRRLIEQKFPSGGYVAQVTKIIK